MAARSDRMDTIVSLSKRRGFVYPSSEIYGGLRASWDYGPLGVELKNNIKRQWWRSMVQERDDIVGLDSSVILAREVWEASGHVTEFVDPLVECMSCHKRFRADHLIEAYEEKHGHAPEHGLADVTCPNCGNKGTFTEPRMFSGLLRTYLGPVEDESGLAYLRPETAQGIFINYKNVLQSSRKKLPFGIGQIGKSFRNEITPGNFIFRTREFEQAEMEFFVRPGTDEEWHQTWIDTRLRLVRRPRHPQGEPAAVRAPAGEAGPLLQADRGRGVPVRVHRQRVGRAGGHRQPHRLRPVHPRQGVRDRPVLPGPGVGRAVRALRDRARGRYRPGRAGVHAGRLHRGRGPERQGRAGEADRDAVRPADRPGQGGGAAAVPQRRPVAQGARPGRDAAQALEHRLRRRQRHRPPLPPPGRDRHPVLRHGRLRHPGGPGRDRARARLDDARSGSPWTSSRPTWASACRSADRAAGAWPQSRCSPASASSTSSTTSPGAVSASAAGSARGAHR